MHRNRNNLLLLGCSSCLVPVLALATALYRSARLTPRVLHERIVQDNGMKNQFVLKKLGQYSKNSNIAVLIKFIELGFNGKNPSDSSFQFLKRL